VREGLCNTRVSRVALLGGAQMRVKWKFENSVQLMLPFCLRRTVCSATRLRPPLARSLLPRSSLPSAVRLNSTRAPPVSGSATPTSDTQPERSVSDEPRLSLTFTCTAGTCTTRSTHQFTKRAYEKGIVLIECPGCKTRCVAVPYYIPHPC